MAARKRKTTAPPWKQAAPSGGRHAHLSPAAKEAAKKRAKKAGRRYPNLVDNMREAGHRGRKKK